MKKPIIRYFYTPICTESFANLHRLKTLFDTIADRVIFECINTTKKICSDYDWFSTELGFLKTIDGNGVRPLTYNKLFIEGIEITGFPPSKKMIQQVLQSFNIEFPQDAYQTYYKETARESWNLSIDKVDIKPYKKETILDACLICTKFNAFLDTKDYLKEDWARFESEKQDYLNTLMSSSTESVLGFVAYYQGQPIGFVEAYPLNQAAKHGFPISNIQSNGLMITCLNIRKEVHGQCIATLLIKAIIKEAQHKNYDSIEVLAYPDDYSWHPKTLYQKHDFSVIKTIDSLSLMKRKL